MKRSELKRKTALHAKSPMKKRRSAKARAKEFSSTVRQIVYERSQMMCEICHQRPLQEIHHAIFRSQGTAEEVSVLSNAIGLCKVCHDACHATRAMREYAVELARELAGEKELTK